MSALSASVAPETVAAIQVLRQRYPETPFLTLGQTVLWDEPVKATFCRLCEELERAGHIAAGARMVAGVHDTDYFAKLDGVSIKDEPFVVLRHNDGDTRGLWSAAGELSALFGAEVVPSRHDLARDGVSFRKAARAYPGGGETLLNQETDAPLWRAIVYTEPRPLIAADVQLGDILPALQQQLRWGFRQSLASTGCSPDFENDEPCPSRDVARQILAWVEAFAARHQDATLSDLYVHLIPKIWALVRGGTVCDLETTTSMELFRFSPATANRARFRFVDIFLNPATRELARRCYNDAVRGSGIYTLDQFGDGALPFDVVIPGHGRGTLRLHDNTVVVETEPPVEICDACDPESVGQLAALLQGHFGDGIALVGKAVSLISMLAAEFIFVFHEKASSYTSRTQGMNEALRNWGVDLPLHPMLRLQYATWDALAGVDASFRLPEHLQTAFGRERIDAPELAVTWREVAAEQDALRQRLRAAQKPHELMELLAEIDGDVWREKEAAFIGARGALTRLKDAAAKHQNEVASWRAHAKDAKEMVAALEREKGEFFRAHLWPLHEKIRDLNENAVARLNPVAENGAPRRPTKEERAAQAEQERAEAEAKVELLAQIAAQTPDWHAFDARIDAAKQRARECKANAQIALRCQLEVEKGADAQAARATLARLENEAQLERFKRVRDALWAAESLRYTNYRPTAWWLPMVSPDGHWFSALAKSTVARLEEL